MIKIILSIFYLWSSITLGGQNSHISLTNPAYILDLKRKLDCCYSVRLPVDYLNNSTIIMYFRICSCSYCQDLIQKFKIE